MQESVAGGVAEGLVDIFEAVEVEVTWIALAAITEALQDGGRCLIVDLDHNGPRATLTRLLELGAEEAAAGDWATFRYAEPDDLEHLRRLVTDACAWRPTVAVVDSVGELLPLMGLSSKSPDDFTVAHTRVLKPLAQAGAAVIMIDHLAKASDSRVQGASGTAAKRRAVGGLSLRVRVSLKEAFAPGRGGACHLAINKDRHGGLRAHSAA